MAYVICEPCVDVKDTACVKVCPVDCIYEFEDERQLYIHPGECIDCAACMPECPVQAIFPEASVPSQWSAYIEKNRTIFDTHAPVHAGAEAEVGEAPAIAARTPATTIAAAVKITELTQDRVVKILQAVEDGVLDADIALMQLTGVGAAPARPAAPVPRPAPTPAAQSVPKSSPFDPQVPAVISKLTQVVPEGYAPSAVAEEAQAEPIAAAATVEEPETRFPRPDLELTGSAALGVKLLQPILGMLPAKAKYVFEGYAGTQNFSSGVSTLLNIGLNVFLYLGIARGLAAATLGEGWESDDMVNLFYLLSLVYGFGEGVIRVWTPMQKPDSPHPHRHYLASLYGWLTGWLVWPIVESIVRPLAHKSLPEEGIEPPAKAIPGGTVYQTDELEKKRRYGMMHKVVEEGQTYVITLEMPRKTPDIPAKAKYKLPNDMPDYRLEVWVEKGVVNVRAILDDERFALVAGRASDFPASFLTQFALADIEPQFTKHYEDKTLTIRVWKKGHQMFLEDIGNAA